MSIDALNEALASTGGAWVKLRDTDDNPVTGEILEFEKRDRTNPQGDIVYKRGTQKPRTEWVFTLQTEQRDPAIEDDDGIRKLACNEAMQHAIREAITAAGKTAEKGGTLKVKVSANRESEYEQAEYTAVYEAPKVIDTDGFD